MERFWSFPLVLGAAGAVFGVAALFEGVAPLLRLGNYQPPSVALMLLLGADIWPPISATTLLPMLRWPNMGHVMLALMAYGAGGGTLLGLVAGVFDAIHNRARPRSRTQLAKNLVWCLFYAHVIIAVNLVLIRWFVERPNVSLSQYNSVLWLPGALWLLAMAWGTLRTIATGDVLTPRALLFKLRCSSTLKS